MFIKRLLTRLKSFIWRLSGAIITFSLVWIADNIGLLELPIWVTGIISLLVNEATKEWNSYQAKKGKNFVGGQLKVKREDNI